MLQRTILMLFVSGALSLPAAAQATSSSAPDSIFYSAQTLLLILGMLLAGYRAYEAFDTPSVTLGDRPTPPHYMTQPGQYRLGVTAYVGLCLLIYALIVYFYKELLPIVDLITPLEFRETIDGFIKEGSLSFPLVVICAAAILVILLSNEKDWNPVFMLRRLLWGWVSIPQLANSIMILARDELVVPVEARMKVAGNPDTPNVDPGDFDKERQSLDRHWAETCYIRLWLAQNRAEGSHFTFFNEPSFSWENLEVEYARARSNIAPLKQGSVSNPTLFADVALKIDTLRRQYCKLAACFIVFKNDTKKNAFRDAKQFGVMLNPAVPRANPLRYIAIFFVAIMFSTYLGVWFSAMTWDLLRGNFDSASTQDPELVTRWTGYALATYGMPILVVLLLRYLGWRIDPEQPTSYLASYATIFLISLFVSVVSLVTVIKLVGAPEIAAKPLSN